MKPLFTIKKKRFLKNLKVYKNLGGRIFLN